MTIQGRIEQIAGSGGSGKRGKGTGGGGGSVEQPNSLRSKQIARVVDLISEGPIRGIQSATEVYFDGVPLQNADLSWNVNSLQLAQVGGWPGQPVMGGFAEQQAETPVGVQLKYAAPVIRSIPDTNTDRCRVTVSVPALQVTDKKTGNIDGASVFFAIYVQSDGGGWINIAGAGNLLNIAGKTNTRYQRAYTFALPGTGPWEVRIDRASADSTVIERQDDLFWDSYTAIIDSKINYNLSGCVGITIDAEQFQSIPRRVYKIAGLLMAVPSNYDAGAHVYHGVWDGSFILAWTNNPAWILFDIIRNNRYGLGQFIASEELDRWAFYRIAQWCDGVVPDGKGGHEWRFVCNVVIRDQQEAFDLINSFAAIFRGFIYWSGGVLLPFADMPADPVGLYTNANVIDGLFTYSGADIRGRHTVAHVSWNDPENLGEPRITAVEDQAAVSKYGIQKLDIIAAGCTSEGQAIRTGKWALYTEQYEGETVTFRAGLDTAWARPGDVIEIADGTISGERVGGRVKEGYVDHIITDAPLTYSAPTGTHYLTCMMPDGRVETKPAYVAEGSSSVTVATDQGFSPFSAAPLADSIWIVSNVPDMQATFWRVINVTEPERAVFEITAMPYNASKWGYIENNLILSKPDISNIKIPAVTNLKASDYLVALSAISVGVRMLISWISTASSYDVSYRPTNGNWIVVRTDQLSMDVVAQEGTYDIWVTPLSAIGQRGAVAKIKYTVVGKTALPEDVRNFRIQAVQGVAMFQWAPAQDIDVIIGGSFEMRYSPRTTGATWASSNTVLTSIPGTATTVELPYRPGSYLIRARDITGLLSKNPAVIITTGPDTAYRPFYRICEEPDWLGDRVNTEVQLPQDWLILGTTGGLWDDQTEALQPGGMDSWPDVDILPVGTSGIAEGTGTYDFDNRIDMGGVFPVRLTVDMLAFPFLEGDVFIDDRPGNVDDWQDWDNASDDAQGMVTIRVRQTDDDPASPAARWTNWTQFISGEYTGRGFEFQAWLTAPSGQNVAVEELCILADVSAKQESGADVAWVPSLMHIAYTVKFFLIPSISIAIQQGVVGDTFRITNKTREGFDLELIAGTGAVITGVRTFDWIAAGY